MKVAGFVLACVAASACASILDRTPALFPALRQSSLSVTTSTGSHEFSVWIAEDPKSRERGLMFVRDLPASRGMLFLFEFPQPVAFWMKNTCLPLDLVFIAENGSVLNIAENAVPFSLDPIESDGDALAVLEVLGGTARRIGLKAHDRVDLPTLRATATIPSTAPANHSHR